RRLPAKAAGPHNAGNGGAIMRTADTRLAAFGVSLCFVVGSSPLAAAEPGGIESDLVITVQGKEQHVSLKQALSLLDITSASIALIDEGRIAFARAYGKDATLTRCIRRRRFLNSSPRSAPCGSSKAARLPSPMSGRDSPRSSFTATRCGRFRPGRT